MGNADSFAAFVRSNRYPMAAPMQPGLSITAGFGMSMVGGEPRWVVSAEFDPVIKQPVFRFFALHVSERIDVDSSGRVVTSGAIGPRVFSPLTSGGTRLFLDLRAGAAFIGEPGGNFRGAPITSARLGLSGRIGASIDWQRAWSLMRDDPTIDTLTIRGHIRW